MRLDIPVKNTDGLAGMLDTAAMEASAIYAPVLCMVDYGLAQPQHSRVTGYCGVQLGAIDVFRYEGFGLHRGDRHLRHVHEDRMDDYLLTIPLQAQVDFCLHDEARVVRPGELALLPTSRPFRASVASLEDGQLFSALHVRVSGSVLRQRIPHVEQACGLPMRLRPGAGTILRQVCELAIEEGGNLSPNEAHRLASMLIDAVANAVGEAPELAMVSNAASSTTYQRIARQAKSYIEAHLSDPELDTEAVATHCRVSKRYLQTVFAHSGETVRRTIRDTRLERCHEALRSPALRRQSIARIAMCWGFTDLPYFCRAFKARYGIAPSRERVLQS